MELIRTKEEMTAGITNIPLSKPATLYFIFDNEESIEQCYRMFESLKIGFTRKDNWYNNTSMFKTLRELESKEIRMIFRNYSTLRPKLITEWRYLFWEIDSRENALMENVLEIYRMLRLPVYIHKTMRGYHFLSVKPIKESIFKWAITHLRALGTLEQISPALQIYYSNDKYPPITLRIKPNKYVNEEIIFKDGWIMSDVEHSDTKQLRDWINYQNLDKIAQYYQLVWYPIDQIAKEIEA